MNSESSTVDWKGCFATRVEAAAEIFDDIEAFASRTCLNSSRHHLSHVASETELNQITFDSLSETFRKPSLTHSDCA